MKDYTQRRLEKFEKKFVIPMYEDESLGGNYEAVKAFLSTSIQQAEQRSREKMREDIGCICKNLAPASVHFKDCPLGKCHQALAEERERVRESAGKLRKDHARYMETDTFFEVQEVEDIAKEAYNKALDDILASLDKTLIEKKSL